MADSTKRQDREVASTAKQDKKGFKVPRIPGDIMLYPLLVGLLLNSFCPQVLAVGSFTTAVVKGSSTIVGLLLIFMGASINLRAVPEALKTGVVVLVPKLALSIALGLGVAAFCGNNFFGLSALSIIGGIAFCNVALYSGIMTEYGDSGEQGATALLALTAGPTITMLALGVSGFADIKPLVYVGTLLPLVLGIIMGNASPFLKNLLVPGINPCIAVVGFSLGCGMSLEQLIQGGLSGVLLAILCIVIGVLTSLFEKLCGGSGKAGVASGTVAGTAATTPKAFVEADASYTAIAPVATAQIAAAVVITAFFAPIITGWVDKKFCHDTLSSDGVQEENAATAPSSKEPPIQK